MPTGVRIPLPAPFFMEKTLKQLIEDSQRILITSHISPDPDAVSSVLLLGRTLKSNYPDKETRMILEEKPSRNIDFLEGYDQIKFGGLLDEAESFAPDLFVMVDVANLARISRLDGEKIRVTLKSNQTKIVIIDHHEELGKDHSEIYINEQLAATVQQIYKLCFNQMGLQKPEGYAETTLLGIITDTNRFKYQNPKHAETFKVVDELLDSGASIEKIENITERYNPDQIEAFVELLKNLGAENDYNYSFLSDGFMDEWQSKDKSFDSIKNGSDLFINQFLRNYNGNYWGFVVFKDYLSGSDTYSARFRAIEGSRDVSILSSKLGGGGHKGAAGAKFEANSVQAAIDKVKSIIADG
jgi:bifunctional oligoribonuclease and PAP phosphatase NrnA